MTRVAFNLAIDVTMAMKVLHNSCNMRTHDLTDMYVCTYHQAYPCIQYQSNNVTTTIL